jgi:hypothetical protein
VSKKKKGFIYWGKEVTLKSTIQPQPANQSKFRHYTQSGHILKVCTPDNLHAHETIDGFWFSLRRLVRFHGKDFVIGEFGPREGSKILDFTLSRPGRIAIGNALCPAWDRRATSPSSLVSRMILERRISGKINHA